MTPGTASLSADALKAAERIAQSDRIIGASAARAVDRFNPAGPSGYKAATAPSAPSRTSRVEAMADELEWLESPERQRGDTP